MFKTFFRCSVFAKTVYRVLREKGYEGSYSLVNRRVQQIIHENEAAGLYPAELPRARKATEKQLTLSQKIVEEDRYAADRI